MKLYGFAIGAFALSLLASCSNDVNKPDAPEEELPAMQLAQAPDLVIWSGDQTFAGTRAVTRADDQVNVKYQRDEVEVNLAIQDLHPEKYGEVEDFIAHLSIHVRSLTDVKVVLPISEDYYVDQDDLYIYKERNIENWEVEYTENSVKATVGNQEVTLTVTFGENITITTSGINNQVLEALTTPDGAIAGINFDVYTYFNAPQNPLAKPYYALDELVEELNNSKITFLSKVPDYYVNAVNSEPVYETEDPEPSEEDSVPSGCTVTPEGDFFNAPQSVETNWGTNYVYTNKSLVPDEDGDEEGENPDGGSED